MDHVAKDVLRVKITDVEQRGWEVPEWLFAAGQLHGDGSGVSDAARLYEFHYEREPFGFTVTRSTGEAIVDTTGHRLVFKVRDFSRLLPRQAPKRSVVSSSIMAPIA